MLAGTSLTQCGWVPVASQPARGTQDAAALRWGRSRGIYWWRGSAFWPETSIGREQKRPSPRVGNSRKQFRELASDVNLHNWVSCLFTVSKAWISSQLVLIQWVLVSAASQKYNARSASSCVHVIWRVCCVRVQNMVHKQQQHCIWLS